MLGIFTIPYMAFVARMAGGGLGAHILDKKGHKLGIMPFGMTWFPEFIFALSIGVAVGYKSSWWISPLITLWCYFIMERGHGTVYKMQGWQSSDANRIDSLERIIRPIFGLFRWSIYKPAYSWAVMGLKGFLIGLPLFPFGLILAVLWPFSYSIKNTVTAEYLTGAFTGLCIFLFLLAY